MEVNLNSYSTWGALLQQGDFDRLHVPEGETPQIYFICRRPKITFDPTSVKKQDSNYELDLVFSRENDTYTQRIQFPQKAQGLEFDFDTQPPFTHFNAVDKSGKTISGSAAVLAALAKTVPVQYLDLEILYIGQSVSNSPDYNIIERLRNHSTLQAIYAEAIRHSPNHDIWIALFHFEYQEMYMFNSPNIIDGKIVFEPGIEPDTDMDEEMNRMEQISNSANLNQQYINFTEAALIRYFEPDYNQKFRKNFPNPAHSSYASCYELDVHSVSVGLATDAINARIYTDKVEPVQIHGINFVLHNSEERKNLFNLLAS